MEFNNNLLTNPIYVKLIKTTIKNINVNIQMENKNQLFSHPKDQKKQDKKKTLWSKN